jgi:hypothetical protein
MSRTETRKITRRFLVLTMLLACFFTLVLSGSAPQHRAQAVVCCSTCDETFQDCYLNCGEPPVGQGFYWYNQCINACARRHSECTESCDSGC